jgi:hypothetical protein
LEATGIQVTLAGRPVKIIAAYLSPSRPLIGVDLTAYFGGRVPVLIVDDLNAKQWNSRLTTKRGKLLLDYADGNSYLIFVQTPQLTTLITPALLPIS